MQYVNLAWRELYIKKEKRKYYFESELIRTNFMKVISKDTETKMLMRVEEIKQKPFGYRCILVKTGFANNSMQKFKELLENLIEVLKEIDAEVFIFSDFEMAIVFKGLTLKLQMNLETAFKNYISADIEKFMRIYDFEKNASVIVSVINRKIEVAKIEKEANKISSGEAEKEKEYVSNELVEEASMELIKTISDRRKGRAIKILLVEDDAFSRRLVKNILSKNYEVIEAETGKDAYNKYITHAPNIVFMDINLPDASGITLLEKLHNIDKYSFVVMLSGNAYKDNIVSSMQKGAMGFVAKPFPKDKISQYIEKYINDNKAVTE